MQHIALEIQHLLVSSPSAGAPGGVLDATGQGTITYQWQISENNADWTNIGGANLVSYSPPALITTTYYRRKLLVVCLILHLVLQKYVKT